MKTFTRIIQKKKKNIFLLRKKINLKLISLFFFIFYSNNAYGYLDPGIVSNLIQIIIALIASVGVILYSIRDYILNIFNKIKNKNRENKSKKSE